MLIVGLGLTIDVFAERRALAYTAALDAAAD